MAQMLGIVVGLALIAILGLLLALLAALKELRDQEAATHGTLQQLVAIEQDEQAHRAKLKATLAGMRGVSGRDLLRQRLEVRMREQA